MTTNIFVVIWLHDKTTHHGVKAYKKQQYKE